MSWTRTTVCLLAIIATSLSGSTGCRSSQASEPGQPAAMNAEITINPTFQSRNPRPCPSVRHRPSNAEAAALVQCTQDSVGRDHITLMQSVSVAVSSATKQRPIYDVNDIDVSAAVYPISGNLVIYSCAIVDDVMKNSGKNCNAAESLRMNGVCYSNMAGDYRCQMGGGDSGFIHPADPPPTSY